LTKQQPHWALYKDPRGNDIKNGNYVDCYAIDTSQKGSAGHYKVLSKHCSEKLPVVCSVADGEKCAGKKEMGFNNTCLKIVGEGDEFDAENGEKACEKEGAKLASVHSWMEDY
ncbi:hypothetical protein AAVH_39011, partial [Aphelenchoides avenae]